MKNKKALLSAVFAAFMLLSACGGSTQKDTSAQDSSTTSQVASASDMTDVEDVVEDSMTPITGDKVKDGTYDVTVDSSSNMFNVTACELTVKNGEMTAKMHMGGTGYLYVYMGTGEEAAAAEEADYIPFTEEADGTHSFTVPVKALDEGIDCAAFSKKKEKWYDRTLVFCADSLPADALADGVMTTAESLSLADGTYTADVTLSGGSGRASVESPAALTVSGGKVTAKIIWSSKNYDYMKVNDEKHSAYSKSTLSVGCMSLHETAACVCVVDCRAVPQPDRPPSSSAALRHHAVILLILLPERWTQSQNAACTRSRAAHSLR